MSPFRAVRGATTLDSDTAEQVTARVQELVREMIGRNGLALDDIVSILLTATPDVHSQFPATAARGVGLDDVPLMGAQEIDVAGAKPLCVRVMMHVESDLDRHKVRHVYLHGARDLRHDLAE